MRRERVISRHRLPRPYRVSLCALWLAPLALLSVVLVARHGLAALFDPRLLLPLLVMGIPACYVWREGVDVLQSGIVRRVHLSRYYPFEGLDTWYYDPRDGRRVLTVWDAGRHKVLEVRAAHLTDLPGLLRALDARVRSRPWSI
jgi:hypothetical protein